MPQKKARQRGSHRAWYYMVCSDQPGRFIWQLVGVLDT